MEKIRFENFSFAYPDASANALDNISLCINPGEFITVCGKSGSGKSTLLRSLKPLLAPYGTKNGKIYLGNTDISDLDERTGVGKIGFVMQHPDNQLVTDKVWHELAFGLESLGLDNKEIRLRVAEIASFFGIGGWFHKKVSELSGGQKQLLNLASVMVMQPEVIILDEPTSQLDPISASEFFKMLSHINKELGVTVILSEHRLEEAFPVADKVLVMDGGRIIFFDTPHSAAALSGNDIFDAFPTAMRVYASLPRISSCPVSVREGREVIYEMSKTTPIKPVYVKLCENASETAIEIRDVCFRYEKTSPNVINGASAKIKKGEIFALLGENGSGKSTLLSLISGRQKPQHGKISVNGSVAMLCQNPQLLFVKNTLEEDLFEMLSGTKLTKEEKALEIDKVLSICELGALRNRHPYDLSGGEMQKAAIAMMLLLKPDILLLDEPTKGLDAHFKIKLSEILFSLKQSGKTIVLVSHDVEFCAAYANMCALIFDGDIIGTLPSREFFTDKSFYTTAANRIARGIIENVVLAEDIISALGGTPPEKKMPEDKENPQPPSNEVHSPALPPEKKGLPKKNIFAALILLVAVPLTILVGNFLFDDRKYYFISLLIILETMLPFAVMFEKRKPRARELVIISVLCGIAVAGRAAFYMLPQIKPMLAVVIIAGACLGSEMGFLVGALSAFISNFFMGQGPWTPWQMFALGIIGFLAGVLFTKIFKKRRIPMCIFGAVTALVIYGGIMDPVSVVMSQNNPTPAMFVAAYTSGLYFNLLHAAATVTFLWLIAEPMIKKLERIKIKYGILK